MGHEKKPVSETHTLTCNRINRQLSSLHVTLLFLLRSIYYHQTQLCSFHLYLLWFLPFMYSHYSLACFGQHSYLFQQFVSPQCVNNKCVLSGRPFSFPSCLNGPLPGTTSNASLLFFSPRPSLAILMKQRTWVRWWNWPSCFPSPAPIAFDICRQ